VDVLIAYPLVGPNLLRLARLLHAYPATTFRVTVDDPGMARLLATTLADLGRPLPVLVDLDVGMGRTGIAPGRGAEALYELVAALDPLQPDGLHIYDGHLVIPDPDERARAAREVHDESLRLRDRLEAKGLPVPRLVFGGTPTFPMHAALNEPGVECSPGTCTLHDAGYASKFPDLPFVPAAALLTRVVSRPRPNRLCLDLGHKAVAGDPPAARRVQLLDLPDAEFPAHSEEHLVVTTPRAAEFPVGSALLALPIHICPTCALHRRAFVIEAGQWIAQWEVVARDRILTI
jgi:D-serine deaminase-like pyridoxal phosphate-dependent protein